MRKGISRLKEKNKQKIYFVALEINCAKERREECVKLKVNQEEIGSGNNHKFRKKAYENLRKNV